MRQQKLNLKVEWVAKENQLRAAVWSFVEIKDSIERSLKPHCVQGLAVCHNRCYTAPPDPYLRLRCSFPSSHSVGWHRCVPPGRLPWAEGSCCTHGSAPCCWSCWHPMTDGGGPAAPHLHQGNSEGCSHLQSPLWDYWCFSYNCITVQPHSIKIASLLSEQYQPLEHHQ